MDAQLAAAEQGVHCPALEHTDCTRSSAKFGGVDSDEGSCILDLRKQSEPDGATIPVSDGALCRGPTHKQVDYGGACAIVAKEPIADS